MREYKKKNLLQQESKTKGNEQDVNFCLILDIKFARNKKKCIERFEQGISTEWDSNPRIAFKRVIRVHLHNTLCNCSISDV